MKLVAHNGSRVWGGNEKWLTLVATELTRRGHQVVVSCRRDGVVRRRMEERGVRTTPLRPTGDASLLSVLRFARWLRRERPDAVLLTSWNRTAWGAWAARRAGARVVLRMGFARQGTASRVNRLAVRRNVDAVIVNAHDAAASWLRYLPGFPADRVHLVWNGVPIPPPLPMEARGAARAALGLDPAATLVACVGALHPRKGVDLMIDALARLGRREARLVIVGSGPAERELRARATALGVAERIHWLGFRADAAELMPAFDLFVLGSRNEGMANVMLEAMAAGVPVVATRVSGVAEALEPREGRPAAGWVVPPDDAAALALAIDGVLATLATDPAAVRARADEGRWRAEHWFGIERMVDQVERVLFPTPAVGR